MKRRLVSPFSMSFLDIMFCGFGAVVLLVIILNNQVLEKRKEKSEDLRAELNRVTRLEQHAQADFDQHRKRVEAVRVEKAELQRQIARLEDAIGRSRNEARQAEARARELKQSISALESGNKAIQSKTSSLNAKKGDVWSQSDRRVGFEGTGKRQYLTGLKLGGERTLVLLDSSASMLDETIVNIVRRKFMSADSRRRAPKWQRAVRTLHWLIANLQPGKMFQVYQFNTRASPVVEGSDGQWMRTDDVGRLEATISAARRIAPHEGTNLERAFEIVGRLAPKPDNVILLTDGLPTQGIGSAPKPVVSGEERVELYDQAVARLPRGIPVNTLLFPIEGDPAAAEAFWRLAIKTRGSLIAPSRDWP